MSETPEREKEMPELLDVPEEGMQQPDGQVDVVSRAPEEVVSEPIPPPAGRPLPGNATEANAGAFIAVGSFGLLVLLTVATAIPWMSRASFDGAASIRVTLWNHQNILNGDVSVVANVCDTQQRYARAAASFMIINIALALALFCVSIRAQLFANRYPGRLVGALFACISLCALISWSIGVAMYYRRLCGIESFENRRFDLGAGVALTITVWVVAGLLCAVSLWNPTLPPAISEEARVKIAVRVVTVAAALAFVFSVVGTPLVVFQLWTDVSSETQTTIWHQRTYFDGSQTSKVSTTELNCGRIDNMFMFSRGSAILSIVFTLATVLLGVRHVRMRSGQVGNIIPFGIVAFLAFLWTLLKCAADLSIFYQAFCSGALSLHGQNYRLRAGFALFAASFVVLFATLCYLVFAKLRAFLSSTKATHGHTTVGALLFLAGAVVAFLFVVLATSQPLMAKNEGNDYIRLFWWDVMTNVGGAVSHDEYPCDALKQRLAGGGAWCIISLAPLLLAVLFGVAQLSHGDLRRHASVCGLIAAVPQLISWALGVASFHGSFCSAQRQSLAGDDYYIASGLGLLIAAWCLTVVISLINLRF